MHPVQFENLSHTTWIADSYTGVSSITFQLSDIPKLWRLVSRKSESKLLFCPQQNPWMPPLQTMAKESSESKKLSLSSPHFHIQNFPIPSVTVCSGGPDN